MIKSGTDKGSLSGPAVLYKMKIGHLRPKYILFSHLVRDYFLLKLMKYSHLPGHFGTLTMRSVFQSVLVSDFIS